MSEIAADEAIKVVEGCEGGTCFAAGTPVWVIAQQETTSQKSKRSAKSAREYAGVKPVEEVKAGDRVLSRNPQTGKVETKRVLRTTLKQAKVVVSVGLAEGKSGKVVDTLTASREHPFYVRGKGFVPAGGLAIGNAIVTRAGPDLIVKRLDWHRRAEGYKVYNFVVEDDHTYFVGLHDGGVWVHNPNGYRGFSSKTVYQAIRDFEKFGGNTITVNTREEAAEVFEHFYGDLELTDTTGMSAPATKAKYGSTDNTFHWDEKLDAKGQLDGHAADNPDEIQRHLQIHIEEEDTVRFSLGSAFVKLSYSPLFVAGDSEGIQYS